jgi:UDP-glucose 4-epimerase
MKILVTGGTGYIGSHTVVELQQSGYDVVIIDNLSNSKLEVLDAIQLITGIRPEFEKIDMTDNKALSYFFDRYMVDGIIHFAALKAVSESVERPLNYYSNNIGSMVNLLSEINRKEIGFLVFSSSCTVYGQPENLPVNENAPVQRPLSPYGNTKRICEEIMEDISKISDLKAISLRYFNPIGAHESALIGELPLGVPNNLVPYITQTAIGIRHYLRVFGNDYNTPDGTPIRDYIHVVDLAQAHVVAINRLFSKQNKSDYEIFNLGTGQGSSVLEVIRSFEKVSGEELNYKIEARRPGDVEKVWADTTLANVELGWKAQRDLDDMMRSAWNWEKALSEKL